MTNYMTLCTLIQIPNSLQSYIAWFENQCLISWTRLWFLQQYTTGALVSNQGKDLQFSLYAAIQKVTKLSRQVSDGLHAMHATVP